MKLGQFALASALTIGAFGLNAAPALAANTTCANREAMLVNTTENWPIAAAGSAFFATRLTAGRSYAFLAWTPFEDAGEGGGTVTLNLFSDTACATAAAFTSVETREPWSNLASADIDAISFIAPTSGEYVLQVGNGEARGVSNRIVIYETSLYSPWFFSGGNNQSFVTISNRSNLSVTVTLTVNTSTGTQCGTSSPVIPANGATFINVNTLGTCAGTFGSSQVSFVGVRDRYKPTPPSSTRWAASRSTIRSYCDSPTSSSDDTETQRWRRS